MKLKDFYRHLQVQLELSKIESAALEAKWILEDVTKISPSVIVISDEIISPQFQKKALQLLERRQSGEPLAYVLGSKHFYGHEFIVGSGVLIPRPETEMIVDLIKSHFMSWGLANPIRIADLGTGSGCLGISIFQELSGKSVDVDLYEKSSDAIKIAKKNIKKFRCAKSVKIISGDVGACLKPIKAYDAIVANPPYIATADPLVEPEVRKWEPESALFAENNGLSDIFKWSQLAGKA